MSLKASKNDKPKKLSTEAYKGVRDFYPEDMAVEKRIFEIWRTKAELYGYEEYNASVLEPAELYRAKSGEEIVNDQTYTFTDRGDREVTLRPEMTPTVARMVAGKRRELVFPLRWYSIPNLFRYEQPQRGRVREHWQLNLDLFGVESLNAEIEVIGVAYDITKAYGLKDSEFEIRINSRRLMDYISRDVFGLSEEAARKMARLIDKKEKLSPESFKTTSYEIFRIGSNETKKKLDQKAEEFLTLLNSKNFEDFAKNLPQTKDEHVGLQEIKSVIKGLEEYGISNARFDQTLMRGFDYYTGIVFEVYDLNPKNRRSVFGGGRYDDLLSLFGNDKVTAVGFGAGDVIARDLMETYGTLREDHTTPPSDLMICIVGEQNTPFAVGLAKSLRTHGIRTAVDLSGKKVGDQIAHADKRGIPFVICIGNEEVKTGKLRLKVLKTEEEIEVSEEDIAKRIKA